MSNVTDFYLEFDSKWGIYKPGDELSGKVVINLRDSIVCDLIELTVSGSAHVAWTERKTIEGRSRDIRYEQEQVYFDKRRVIWESDEQRHHGGPNRPTGALQLFSQGGRLSKGKHKFKFVFTLPADIPTSFEVSGTPAYVRYHAIASLFTNGCSRVAKKLSFCVCPTVDLPLVYPNSGEPVTKKDRFVLPRSTIFSRTHGSIGVTVTLPKTGYVPGEPVNVEVSTENNSSRKIKAVVASIRLRSRAIASEPEPSTKLSVKNLAENRVKFDDSRGGNTHCHQVTNCLVFVPAVSPNIRIPGLLETEYFLHVEVSYSSSRPPIRMNIPIIIGTVPIACRPQTGPYEPNHAQENMNYGERCQNLLDTGGEDSALRAIDGLPDYVNQHTTNQLPLPTYADIAPLNVDHQAPPTYEESCMSPYQPTGLMSAPAFDLIDFGD